MPFVSPVMTANVAGPDVPGVVKPPSVIVVGGKTLPPPPLDRSVPVDCTTPPPPLSEPSAPEVVPLSTGRDGTKVVQVAPSSLLYSTT